MSRLNATVVVPALVLAFSLQAEAQDSWEGFGLDGMSITDLESVGPYLYACVVDGDGNGRGVFRRFTGDPDSGWVSIGPDGVGLGAVWVYPLRPDTMFASVGWPFYEDPHVVYRSENGGQSWEAADSGIADDVGTVVGWRLDASLLLFAGNDGIYRSDDFGETWGCCLESCDHLFASFESIAFDPRGSSVAWASLNTGIETTVVLKSVDSGASWDLSFDCGCSAGEVAVDLRGRAYAAVASNSGEGKVVFTDDGGDTWQQIVVDPTRGILILDVAPWSLDYLVAGTRGVPAPVWLSTDRAETWTNHSTGLPPGSLSVATLEADAVVPGVFYAGLEDHGVWRLRLDVVVDVPLDRDRDAPLPTLQALPNPARGDVIFVASGAAGYGSAWVVILDAAGRAVRSLPAALDPAVFRWDGRDEAGWSVPSGTYFAVLHTGAGRSARKFTWLRD
jgi:hypothetical protein